MLPYGRQSVDESDVEAVAAVLRGDWLTTGPAVDRFEAAISGRAGDTPAVVVTSGTAALHVAYHAAGLGPGRALVTTPMTFVATAATAVALGASVSFADVEPDTGNLDPAAAEAAVDDATSVIAAVDFAGHPAELDALGELARRSGSLLVEDAAHALGARWHGRPVGSIADLTTFSFFPTKTITSAEGGAVLTRDSALLRRARHYRNHGLVRDASELRHPNEGGWHQEVHELGLNYRLPDVLCALGTSQLARLDAFLVRRNEIHRRYDEAFADLDGMRTPVTRPGAEPGWHLYSIRVLADRRRALYERLRERGIGVQVTYVPVYWHPAFEDLGYRRGLCPNAEQFYRQQLSLPLFPGLSDDDVGRVIDEVRDFFGASTT